MEKFGWVAVAAVPAAAAAAAAAVAATTAAAAAAGQRPHQRPQGSRRIQGGGLVDWRGKFQIHDMWI